LVWIVKPCDRMSLKMRGSEEMASSREANSKKKSSEYASQVIEYLDAMEEASACVKRLKIRAEMLRPMGSRW